MTLIEQKGKMIGDEFGVEAWSQIMSGLIGYLRCKIRMQRRRKIRKVQSCHQCRADVCQWKGMDQGPGNQETSVARNIRGMHKQEDPSRNQGPGMMYQCS